MSRPILYKAINAGYPFKIRGANHQTDVGLIYKNPIFKGTTSPDGLTGATTTATIRQEGMTIGQYGLYNRAVAANLAGIGVRIPNQRWVAGLWTQVGTSYTDTTANFQSSTLTQIIGSLTVNDGFAVFCNVPFNYVTLNITTADSSTAPTRDFSYTQATTMVNDVPTASAWKQQAQTANMAVGDGAGTTAGVGVLSAREAIYVWDPPADWGVTPAAGNPSWAVNAPGGMYGIRIRATTAPGVCAIATGMEIGLLVTTSPPLTVLNTTGPAFYTQSLSSGPVQIMYGDALVAMFSIAVGGPTAGTNGVSMANSIDAMVRPGVA